MPAMDAEPPVLHVPARDVPVPTSVSAEARGVLSMGAHPFPPYPPLDDLDGWRAFQEMGESAMRQSIAGVTATDVDVDEKAIGDATVYVVTPKAMAADDRRVYLDIHGGGLMNGGGTICRAMAITWAARIQAPMWSVDYRMPPNHLYPAALDDCLRAYTALLEERRPEEIIIGGPSAGANLAAATVLRARDEGLPMPAAVVLLTPEIDLTESGDSFQANLGLDTVLGRGLMPVNQLYAGEHDLAHPYLSPLFGDFTKGFPPTFLSAGTRDLFLSNAVRMHRSLRNAGVDAELHVIEAGPHAAFFGMTPEDRDLDADMRRFLGDHWGV